MTKDEVLFAFHRYVTNPTLLEVDWWVNAFPQFSVDIRAHAVDILDMRCRVEAARFRNRQALGAAISRREWSEVEAAHAAIRDEP